MAPFAPHFTELLESELPDWLPRPEAPGGAAVAWFRGERPLDGATLELYVWRAGDGGSPPFTVSVLSGSRAHSARRETPTRACWPRLEDVWAALNETCLEGALFQLPAHIAGEKYLAKLDGQAVTIVQAVQVGALGGSPAFFRFSIVNKGAGVLQ
jgi:hypothetical protein